MCHITMLSSEQIEALEALPFRFRRDFEIKTDYLSVRDRKGVLAAFDAVMDAAGKSGEKVLEQTSA